MRYLIVLLAMSLVVAIPLTATAVDWTNGYGYTTTYVVPSGSGHIAPITVDGSVTRNWPDSNMSCRLRYGHYGTGTGMMSMSSPGLYAGFSGSWNFTSGYWDMYMSGGSGAGTIAGWAIHKGTPTYYE